MAPCGFGVAEPAHCAWVAVAVCYRAPRVAAAWPNGVAPGEARWVHQGRGEEERGVRGGSCRLPCGIDRYGINRRHRGKASNESIRPRVKNCILPTTCYAAHP